MIFSKEFISHTTKNLTAVKVKGISKELTHVNVSYFEEKTCLLHILSFSKLNKVLWGPLKTHFFFFFGNCTLLTCGLACFNSVYLWFKSYHLTHLSWPPLNLRYPPQPFPLKNPLYYISHNRNRIRSNITKNDFSLTILEIKSSNPNPISWPESYSINTIIGSFLMYILPTIYIKSCRKKKKKKNNGLKVTNPDSKGKQKETHKSINPRKFESTALHCFDLNWSRQSGCSVTQPISQFHFSCFFVFLLDLGFWAVQKRHRSSRGLLWSLGAHGWSSIR